MNEIKIMFVSHSAYINGAENVLLNILRNLDRNKFTPLVLFPESGPLVSIVSELGIDSKVVQIERWIRFKGMKPLKRSTLESRVASIMKIIKDEKIDIVHSNTSVILEGAIAAKLSNILHVWHIHENLKEYIELKPVFPLELHFALTNAFSDCILTVSESTAHQFSTYAGEKKINVLHNAVSLGTFSEKEYSNTKIESSNEIPNIVSVAPLIESKGYIELINALSIIKNKNIPFHLKWVGSSNRVELRKFKLMLRATGLRDHVSYLGFRSDIPIILKSSDIFVCPSRNEAFPMVVLEAMAARVPIVATNCGGISEAVLNNYSGFVVPVNDVKELGLKMEQLLLSPKLRKTFSDNAFDVVKNKFNDEKYIQTIEKLYLSLVGSRKNNCVSNKENALTKLIAYLLPYYEHFSDLHWKTIK